ncbi:MAG: hypothetical protein ISR59_04295 [Anaerolineales bacterium]|uniref:Uncharacterized protein n=1 Tax=Candidatus Desulfolinea nitratireducens TaxID=2841698 RepID=A0A8J6NMG7_9CHLR|nr:hypothetical protein [Candidatus Desulfolinea nitratireducens]MBL6960306.1 hypothetical protein [Anaerolineales bacterium]
MNRKLFALFGILALLLTLVPMAVSVASDLPDYKPVDVGPELRTWETTQARIEGGLAAITPEEIEALEAEAEEAVRTKMRSKVPWALVWISFIRSPFVSRKRNTER